MLEKYLIEQIHNIVADMKMQLDSLETMLNNPTVEKYDRHRIITKFINLEYLMGKYNAYLSMLDDHEYLESFARLHDANKPLVTRFFNTMEKLYTI